MIDPSRQRSSRLRVSEVFRSLQGEGPTAGLPATFLRLTACNLRCRYCDTPYTWDFERFDVSKEVKTKALDELAEEILAEPTDRLIVTGGEPMLQQHGLAALFERLPTEQLIEIETNGTILPDQALWDRVSQWNVSPKLALSGLPREERIILPVLREFSQCERAYLKLVVAEPTDMAEGDQLVSDTAWPAQRVVWMPEGTSAQRITLRGRWLADQALARKQRFSTRLHVLLWGDQRGR
ncbi:MAG TPA: 7-carboxy-7-deazaguanine synthase QueE [Polyangiaceae bacterium]|nr:7-carboxy-7-deazaguanine synthase QueE [Polyangiaceae bacterium]